MSRILFVHGGSSSGKSTLIAALRHIHPQPLLHISFDHLRDSGMLDMARYGAQAWKADRARVFDGLHRSIAGFADAGNDLVVEHILDTPGWHEDLRRYLAGHAVFFVRLFTSPGVLSAREDRRGDRAPGSALHDAMHVHHGMRYDMELDGTLPPDRNARDLLTAWQAHAGRSRFFED